MNFSLAVCLSPLSISWRWDASTQRKARSLLLNSICFSPSTSRRRSSKHWLNNRRLVTPVLKTLSQYWVRPPSSHAYRSLLLLYPLSLLHSPLLDFPALLTCLRESSSRWRRIAHPGILSTLTSPLIPEGTSRCFSL